LPKLPLPLKLIISQLPLSRALIHPQKVSSRSLEQALVLACVSVNRENEVYIRDILQHELDWQNLGQTALQQGVFPLFYQRLKTAAEKQIPHAEIVQYDQWFQTNVQNNIRLSWKLIQFVDLLSTKGIETVVLKGPVFALQAFGDLTLRRYTDLDVLIHQEDFSQVYDLFCQNGYSPSFTLGSKQKKFQVRSDNHFPFTRQGDVIEVHWEIAPKGNVYPITRNQTWQGLNRLSLLGQEITSLSRENTIIFT
jgi:hypothetical protein